MVGKAVDVGDLVDQTGGGEHPTVRGGAGSSLPLPLPDRGRTYLDAEKSDGRERSDQGIITAVVDLTSEAPA